MRSFEQAARSAPNNAYLELEDIQLTLRVPHLTIKK